MLKLCISLNGVARHNNTETQDNNISKEYCLQVHNHEIGVTEDAKT